MLRPRLPSQQVRRLHTVTGTVSDVPIYFIHVIAFPVYFFMICHADCIGGKPGHGGSHTESFSEWLVRAELQGISEDMLPKLQVCMPVGDFTTPETQTPRK